MWPFTREPKTTHYQVGQIFAKVIYKYNNEIKTDIMTITGKLISIEDGKYQVVNAWDEFSLWLQNSVTFGFIQLPGDRFILRENILEIKLTDSQFEIIRTE